MGRKGKRNWDGALPLRGRWAMYFVRGVICVFMLLFAPSWGVLRLGLPHLFEASPGSLQAEVASWYSVSFSEGFPGVEASPMYLYLGYGRLSWSVDACAAGWTHDAITLATDLLFLGAAVLLVVWTVDLVQRVLEAPLRSKLR